MEDFWENIKSLLVILVKVAFISILVDGVLLYSSSETRLPFVSIVNDWVVFKAKGFIQ